MTKKIVISLAFIALGVVGTLLYIDHPGRAIQVTNYLYFVLLGFTLITLCKGKELKEKATGLKAPKLSVRYYLLLFIIPAIFVFQSLATLKTVAWGDAPHFFPKEMSELISEPYAWTSRGENLGGVDPRIYIWPLLFVYGLLGKLGLSSEIITRALFYFPAIILSAIGPVLLARRLKFSETVAFFASFVYVFNTYFLLLIDGGQVGIALAYGIFPFTLLVLNNIFDKPNIKSFYLALVVLFLNSIADPRVAFLSIFTIFLWKTIEKLAGLKVKNGTLWYAFPLVISWVGLSLYWIIPLLKIPSTSLSTQSTNFQFLSLLNGLVLFSPHWPGNIFGQVFSPDWLFVGTPLLIFSGLFLKQKKKDFILLTLFLIFTFLAKGENFPFGGLYRVVVERVPFATAFRDSSKFFISLALFAGILIGLGVDRLSKGKTLGENTLKIYIVLTYLYLLALVLPASQGKLNFVLSGKDHPKDLDTIAHKISKEDGFFRTAWFPERHPLAFETKDKQALDAKGLADLRPLANLAVGSSDKFNYIYQGDEFLDWYRLLGVKYLIFSGDQRNPFPEKKETKEWSGLLARIESIEGLEKVDWGSQTLVYKLQNNGPQIYVADQLTAVIGPELPTTSNLPGPDVFAYFEDGKLDPLDLEDVESSAVTIVFNNTDEDDLTMSFLQDYFVGVNSAHESEWAEYTSNQYLESKYQLLIRGIVSSDFDYGRGIALSEKSGESISFTVKTENDADYILAIRSMGSDGSIIGYKVDNEKDKIIHDCRREEELDPQVCVTNFRWFTKGVRLGKGKRDLTVTNLEGTNVINTIAVIPTDAWNKAKKTTDTFTTHFGVTGLDDLVTDYSTRLSHSEFIEESRRFDYNKRYPTWFDFEVPERGNWIILTDSYHPDWKLRRGVEYFNSLPAYSMINAFYIQSNWRDTSVQFIGQKQVRWGIYYSTISFLILTIVFLWFYPTKRRKENDK